MIEFKYEVLDVNKAANAMLVKYTADGYQDYTIGTRMPYVGEPLESVINQYAPIPQWRESKMELADVQVGATGTIAPIVPVQSDQPADFTIATSEEQLLAQAEMQKQAIIAIVNEVLSGQSNTVPTTN